MMPLVCGNRKCGCGCGTPKGPKWAANDDEVEVEVEVKGVWGGGVEDEVILTEVLLSANISPVV